jgi:hypothetical protein
VLAVAMLGSLSAGDIRPALPSGYNHYTSRFSSFSLVIVKTVRYNGYVVITTSFAQKEVWADDKDRGPSQ